MQIAVLGSGNVGGTLGRRWAEAGHAVSFGVRNPARGAAAVKGGGAWPATARVCTIEDAVRDAAVLLLATPWPAVADVLRAAEGGGAVLDGRILIDATNPIGPGLTPVVGADGASGAERVQALAPWARVVKCFNSTGAGNMAEPRYADGSAAMFMAGDDTAAKAAVRSLVEVLGFDCFDAGTLIRSRQLESLALLWIGLSTSGMGRDFALRVVRR